jgi:RNA polymerase sigma factor FliA
MGTTVMRKRAPRAEQPGSPSREIWVEYRHRPTVQMRNLLIEAYLPLLRTIAANVKRGLPAQVEVEELVSAGCFGLIHAINAYDPSRNVQFSTFCARRVRGAIIDGLRDMDLPPRQVREREAMVVRVCDSFRKQFGRPPCDEEILVRLGTDATKARRILSDSRVARVSSLSDPTSGRGERPFVLRKPSQIGRDRVCSHEAS